VDDGSLLSSSETILKIEYIQRFPTQIAAESTTICVFV
jgi:hypothetical protein